MKMSKERKVEAMAALHPVLKLIQNHGPQYEQLGICGNVGVMMAPTAKGRGAALRMLAALVATWPGRVSSRVYPVDGNDEYRTHRGDLWDNPRRHELLAYLIERTGSYGHD